MNELPEISIIIPTEGRTNLLSQLLDSLDIARQQFTSSSELLIIDSSPYPVSDNIRTLCENHNAIYISGKSSVRAKRNLGIRNAQFPIILFIDSDCIATNDLLEQHGRMYLQSPLIGGCAGLVQFDQNNDAFFWRMLMRTSFTVPFRSPSQMKNVMWGPTANISYRSHLLNQVNGFDENFPFKLGGDDVDIGVRVSRLGYTIATNPEAKVFHSIQTWHLQAVIRRAFRWGRMHYFLFCKHPYQRTMAMPNTLTIFVFLFAVSILLSTIKQQTIWLITPWLWWTISLIVEAVLLAGTGRKFASIFRDVCAGQFELIFNAGNYYEALRHGDIRPFYQTFSYLPLNESDANDGILLSERRVRQNWSLLLSFIILIAGCLIIST